MKRKIISIKTGLLNFWRWRKVIYKDRDFDHWYIYEILKTKLEFQAKHLHKHGITESAGVYAKQIFECIDLLKKVQTEYYIDEAITGLIDKQWTDEMFNNTIKKQDEVKKELFKVLENNIENWWD